MASHILNKSVLEVQQQHTAILIFRYILQETRGVELNVQCELLDDPAETPRTLHPRRANIGFLSSTSNEQEIDQYQHIY